LPAGRSSAWARNPYLGFAPVIEMSPVAPSSMLHWMPSSQLLPTAPSGPVEWRSSPLSRALVSRGGQTLPPQAYSSRTS
jgi:hypothetical protein